MKKVKFVLWIVIFGFLGLVIYQNREFFLTKQILDLDLYFRQYRSLDLPIALFFVAIFLFGWLIAYLSSLAERYRSSQQVKQLRMMVHSQQGAINAVKMDVEALKPSSDNKIQDPAPGDADDSQA